MSKKHQSARELYEVAIREDLALSTPTSRRKMQLAREAFLEELGKLPMHLQAPEPPPLRPQEPVTLGGAVMITLATIGLLALLLTALAILAFLVDR